jgi:uncharacterized DUF497 family protein
VFFEWDRDKEAQNRRKHGIAFRDAATVFDDLLSTTYPDLAHSKAEQRYITIGMTEKGRIIVVAHTEENDTVRIISARPATRYERRFYEEGQ